MKLRRFQFSERPGTEKAWELQPLTLGAFNLLVGRNATGKTRLLNSIAKISGIIGGETVALSGGAKWEFELTNGTCTSKSYALSGAEKSGSDADLITWANTLQHFPFGGKMDLRIANPKSANGFARLPVEVAFRAGLEKFGTPFHDTIISALNQIGHGIERIEPREPGSLEIKEAKRATGTALRRLSQGQVRSLALTTFLTYLELSGTECTVLIDDLGEGLDFECSKNFSQWLFAKREKSLLQLIVATNDRYIMNSIPLEYWTVLVESGPVTRVFNFENSRQKFDDFKFTGLSNFDFFSMDFAIDGTETSASVP